MADKEDCLAFSRSLGVVDWPCKNKYGYLCKNQNFTKISANLRTFTFSKATLPSPSLQILMRQLATPMNGSEEEYYYDRLSRSEVRPIS